VHCKAGKGRTGTVCCAWLLYAQRCSNDRVAMRTFAGQRSDSEKGGIGVDTPCQKRYVRYIHEYLARTKAYFQSNIPCSMPRPPCIKLDELFLCDMFTDQHMMAGKHVHCSICVYNEKMADCWEEVFLSDAIAFPEVIGTAARCCVINTAYPRLDLNRTVACGDVKLTVHKGRPHRAVGCLDQQLHVAGTEPGTHFFIIFHTAFMDENNIECTRLGEQHMMTIGKNMVDKAWKDKKGKVFNKEGQLQLRYTICGAEVEYVSPQDAEDLDISDDVESDLEAGEPVVPLSVPRPYPLKGDKQNASSAGAEQGPHALSSSVSSTPSEQIEDAASSVFSRMGSDIELDVASGTSISALEKDGGEP